MTKNERNQKCKRSNSPREIMVKCRASRFRCKPLPTWPTASLLRSESSWRYLLPPPCCSCRLYVVESSLPSPLVLRKLLPLRMEDAGEDLNESICITSRLGRREVDIFLYVSCYRRCIGPCIRERLSECARINSLIGLIEMCR